jgi:chromatin remodeling complex protein RSC6
MPAKQPTKKMTKTKTPTATAPVEAAASVEVSAPETVAAPESVAAAVEDATLPTAVADSQVNDASQLEEQFKDIIGRIQEFRSWSATLQSDVKRLQKSVQRHIRDNSKRNRRRKNQSGDKPKRAPSGFAKPALISDDLCAFLGKDKGTEMARTEVTKHLTQYIKNNELQDVTNRRKILPDKKLGQLLKVGDEDEVTYFNLQKYMKVHFPKSASQLAAAASAAAAAAAP